jgi:hypothetical protein
MPPGANMTIKIKINPKVKAGSDSGPLMNFGALSKAVLSLRTVKRELRTE